MLASLEEAQEAFCELPAYMQLPTLSPAYCAADASRDSRIRPKYLLYRADGGVLLHSVHECDVPGGGTDWQSPYGYGGPVSTRLSDAASARAWNHFDRYAQACATIAEFVRFHPLADNHRGYPGTVREDRAVVAIDLRVPDLLASYSVRARNTLRKAWRAGLSAEWSDGQALRERFAALYLDSMRRIGAAPFYHFGEAYFRSILGLPGSRVLAVNLKDRLIAAAILLFGPSVVEYHLSASSPEGRDLGATNLLLHEVACRAKAEGLERFYLGGGTDSSPENPLLRFKASFAMPCATFRFGYRILDPDRYERLREQFQHQAAGARRVLFYRSD